MLKLHNYQSHTYIYIYIERERDRERERERERIAESYEKVMVDRGRGKIER